jgi:hypothetical protein
VIIDAPGLRGTFFDKLISGSPTAELPRKKIFKNRGTGQ